MISLFDIELLSRERLAKFVPDVGQDINKLRLDFALKLKNNGKLLNCPLFSPFANQFARLLGLTNQELLDEFKLPDFDSSKMERLLFIYNIFVWKFGSINSMQKHPWFEYDESFLDHIKILSDEDIIYCANFFMLSTSRAPYIKEFVSRNISMDKFIHKDIIIHEVTMLKLRFSEDPDYTELDKIHSLGSINDLYVFLPTKESIRYLYDRFMKSLPKFERDYPQLGKSIMIVYAIVRSREGRHLYYKLTQEEFNKGVAYLTEIFGVTCDELLVEYMKRRNVNPQLLISAFVANGCEPQVFKTSLATLDVLHQSLGRFQQ